ALTSALQAYPRTPVSVAFAYAPAPPLSPYWHPRKTTGFCTGGTSNKLKLSPFTLATKSLHV
ncbi:hypothetical protein, partial [Enterobacter hormaechei]